MTVPTTVLDCRYTPFRQLRWSPKFSRVLAEHCQRSQVIHDTGVWLPTNRSAATVATKLSLPLVVSPRGMLSAWSLQAKHLRKKLAWGLYQKRDLQSAAVLHATSMQEAQEFRDLKLKPPIAIIPNGVDLPIRKAESGKRKAESRTILFLSRIHPKKVLTRF